MRAIPAFFLAGMLSMMATVSLESLVVGYAVLFRSSFTRDPFSIQQWQPFLAYSVIAATIAAWVYFWRMLRRSDSGGAQ